MHRWNWLFAGRKAFSRSQRDRWAGLISVLFDAVLLLAGIILIAVNVTNAFLFSTPEQFFAPIWKFVIQLIFGSLMIIVGLLRIAFTLWNLGASAERREVIAKRAGEMELLDLRRNKSDLPSVPSSSPMPIGGSHLTFRLLGTGKNSWSLAIGTTLAILLVVVTTIVALTGIRSVDSSKTDWLAFCILGFLIPATAWAVKNFVKQLMKVTGLGLTRLEVSEHPLCPGRKVELFLCQHGRIRLKLLDVKLICQEIATFDEGTNIRTETQTVYQQRLLRKRGILLKPNYPCEFTFHFELPKGTMHSFKSQNNRIQWKIVVHALAKGWPEFEREFAITVHPSNAKNQAA